MKFLRNIFTRKANTKILNYSNISILLVKSSKFYTEYYISGNYGKSNIIYANIKLFLKSELLINLSVLIILLFINVTMYILMRRKFISI